jgi:hypothetical protein
MTCSRRSVSALSLAALLALPLLAAVLAGCGKKEEPPTAPGYYSGPMKPKAALPGKGGGPGGQQGAAN